MFNIGHSAFNKGQCLSHITLHRVSHIRQYFSFYWNVFFDTNNKSQTRNQIWVSHTHSTGSYHNKSQFYHFTVINMKAYLLTPVNKKTWSLYEASMGQLTKNDTLHRPQLWIVILTLPHIVSEVSITILLWNTFLGIIFDCPILPSVP